MRIVIDPMLCDGHALCESIAPAVFGIGDDERAYVEPVAITDDMVPSIREAAMMCPCRAIALVEP
jgi:ferredoxin